MSTAIILENIYYFLNKVLFDAKYASHWNATSFQRALDWSFYCTNLHLIVKNKSYNQQLADMVNSLVSRARHHLCFNLKGLQILEQATIILKIAFLQNPNLPQELLMKLCDDCESEFLKDVLKQSMNLKNQVSANIHLMMELELSSNSTWNEKCGRIKEKIASELHYQNFIRQLCLKNSRGDLKNEAQKIIDGFIDCQDNYNLLFQMLLKNPNSSNKLLRQIQSLLFSKLTEILSSSDIAALKRILSLPIELIIEASEKDSSFFESYLILLIEETQKFEPCYSLSSCNYQHRNIDEKILEFEELIKHFKQLVYFSNTDISKKTQENLLEARLGPDSIAVDEIIMKMKS